MGSASAPLSENGWKPDSILIVKPSSLGDVVHTLPAAAALKRHWPSARLSWLVNPEWAPLLENNPAVDEVCLFPRQRFRGPLGAFRLLAWARNFGAKHSADLVLDFQCLLRSAIIGRHARRGRFYGLSDAREGASLFYDATVPVKRTQHAVDRYLSLARALGVTVREPLEWPLPGHPLPGGFDASRPFLALHPFSRGKGKSLSCSEVEELCHALSPLRIVLVGRSESAPKEMPHVENWLNRTSLPELTSILGRASWTISVDSGPMHIAAALSPRVLAFHTWSDPQKVGPYATEAWVLKDGKIFQRGSPQQHHSARSMAEIAAWLREQL